MCVHGSRTVMSFIWLCLAILPVAAQGDECQLGLNDALTTFATSCAEPVNDTVCYGYGSVGLEPSQGAFTEPGNHFGLDAVKSVRTLAAANAVRGGIAVLTPLDDNQQPVYLVMLGTVTVTTEQLALTPLESLHVATIPEDGACIASLLILYTRSETPITLVLNGQSIAFTGVTVFTQANPFDVKFFVLDGVFYVGDQTVQVGEVLLGLTDNQNTIQSLSNVRPLKDAESSFVNTVRQVLLTLNLEFSEVTPVAATPDNPASGCGENVVHVVQAGENLFRIGLRYGTTVDAIVAANQLANRDVIYAGQQLVIPCPTNNPGVIANPGVTTNPVPVATTVPDTAYPLSNFPDLSFPVIPMPTLNFPVDLTPP